MSQVNPQGHVNTIPATNFPNHGRARGTQERLVSEVAALQRRIQTAEQRASANRNVIDQYQITNSEQASQITALNTRIAMKTGLLHIQEESIEDLRETIRGLRSKVQSEASLQEREDKLEIDRQRVRRHATLMDQKMKDIKKESSETIAENNELRRDRDASRNKYLGLKRKLQSYVADMDEGDDADQTRQPGGSIDLADSNLRSNHTSSATNSRRIPRDAVFSHHRSSVANRVKTVNANDPETQHQKGPTADSQASDISPNAAHKIAQQPYVAVQEVRSGMFTYPGLPSALSKLIQQKIRQWDIVRPDWVLGTEKGVAKCADRIAKGYSNMMTHGPGFACDDCVMKYRVCLAVHDHMIQLRALPPEHRYLGCTEKEMAYWIRNEEED
ncbi:MAG: hypothetical protein Q9180_000262 [Flavoplaca navasiana]